MFTKLYANSIQLRNKINVLFKDVEEVSREVNDPEVCQRINCESRRDFRVEKLISIVRNISVRNKTKIVGGITRESCSIARCSECKSYRRDFGTYIKCQVFDTKIQ